jgi:hypothetical protein
MSPLCRDLPLEVFAGSQASQDADEHAQWRFAMIARRAW